jgi:hypothetical protein
MSPAGLKLWNIVTVIGLALGAALGLKSQVTLAATARENLATLLGDDLQDRPPLFQGTPITHIIPEFNTVTYAADAQWIDTLVKPEKKSLANSRGTEELAYSGWVASPYFALSLRKIGIGFNIEAGNKSLAYKDPGSTEARTQDSLLNYRGLGIYLFYKPFDSRDFVPSLMVGGKSLNASHESGYLLTQSQKESGNVTKSNKYSYGVFDYSVGINTQIRLVKAMTIIPWADYVWVDDAGAHTAAKNLGEYAKTDFNDDVRIFWNNRPPLNYGIDFAVQVAGFEVRLGGLLGAIVASGTGSDQIKDQGLRIAFAWNQKG